MLLRAPPLPRARPRPYHAAVFGPREQRTSVPCPACARGALVVHRGCRQTTFGCGACGERFGLEHLARLVDDARFAELAELVGDHLSDRV